MPYRSKCAKCEKNAVLQWTLYNGAVTVVAPLCWEHGEYLTDIVNLVGPNPATGGIPKTSVRLPRARPIEGWTKPED